MGQPEKTKPLFIHGVPESLHKKLSLHCAKTGDSKRDVVLLLLRTLFVVTKPKGEKR